MAGECQIEIIDKETGKKTLKAIENNLYYWQEQSEELDDKAAEEVAREYKEELEKGLGFGIWDLRFRVVLVSVNSKPGNPN